MRSSISHTALQQEEDLPNFFDLASQKSLIEKEPWDVLIVLDACRWDAYNYIFETDASPVCNPGVGSTPNWVDSIWTQNKEQWRDVTYISGNIQTDLVGDEHHKDSLRLRECVKKYVPAHEEYDNEVSVVLPETMRDHAVEEEPPMVVHFLQPHTPFIGNFTLKVHNREKYDILPSRKEVEPQTAVQRLIDAGLVDRSVVQTAYLSNLQRVRRSVESIVQMYSNYNVVVTADHGEAFGPDHWDHGGNTNQNRVVPWDARNL